MNCKKCGSAIPKGYTRCVVCGEETIDNNNANNNQTTSEVGKTDSTGAIISIILGIGSFVSMFFLKTWMVFALAIIGLLVGITDKSSKRIIGIIINLLAIIITICLTLYAIFMVGNTYDKAKETVFATQVKQVSLEAKEDYYISYYVERKYKFCDESQKVDECSEIWVSDTSLKYYVQLDDSGELYKIAASNGHYCYISGINPDLTNLKDEVKSVNSNILVCSDNNGEVSCSCK